VPINQHLLLRRVLLENDSLVLLPPGEEIMSNSAASKQQSQYWREHIDAYKGDLLGYLIFEKSL
jgi:hypothetical protein